MKRFLLRFSIFSLVGFALMFLPATQAWMDAFRRGLADITALMIRWAGGHATATGSVLASPGGFAMRIVNGCDGTNVIVLLWSAIAAWPAAFPHKAKGFALALLAVQLVNLVRLIALFYSGQWNATWFEWIHMYAGEIVVMVLGVAIFAVWLRRIPAVEVPGPAR